jgi:hypothetical protein
MTTVSSGYSGKPGWERLRDHLVERSGLTSDIILRSQPDLYFKAILEAMETIKNGKEVLYGDYMQVHGGDPELFALMEHFADVKRKFVRAQEYMKKRANGADIAMVELLDTYIDMAVYGALGVRLVAHLMERKTPYAKPAATSG